MTSTTACYDSSLLRAATYPDPHADQGPTTLPMRCCPTWATGRQGGVIPAGYDLNAPALPLAVAAQPAGTLPAAYSQFRVDAPNVVLETVKKAEDGSGLILRLYESWGTRTRAALALPDDAAAVQLHADGTALARRRSRAAQPAADAASL